MNELENRVAELIRRRGPLPFSEVMEAALYDPEHGFYATTGAAGRRGDFLTSVEVGPLFGAVVARALDEWWRDAGEPDPFVVVEGGAGVGTLAVAVLAAQPACLRALRYVLVERSDALRARHADHLVLESAALAFAPDVTENEEEHRAVDVPNGPIVVSLSDLPRIRADVVVANELLDNLPVDLVEGGHEVRVGLDDDRLTEALVPATSSFGVTGRAPVGRAAAQWVRDARAIASRVVVFDYADTTASMASRPWTEWLRTYRGHQRGSGVLADLGTQDITCEVAIDQLPAPTADTLQAQWLRRYGIDDLVEEGRRVWAERASVGDLEAVKARSRVTEADALTDDTGLGTFHVLEWF